MAVTDDPAVSVCFVVTVDGIELGSFNTCEGLGCEVVLEQREEGGNNTHLWQLPTRLKYPNIKLSRPLTRETEKVAKWFASMTTGIKRRTAHIEARTGDGRPVAKWGLLEVVPVRWTGPAFNPESPKVAMETIEIAHHGFVTMED
ncbi:phage tail protein [Streptomyces sp. NPDC004752]